MVYDDILTSNAIYQNNVKFLSQNEKISLVLSSCKTRAVWVLLKASMRLWSDRNKRLQHGKPLLDSKCKEINN